MLEPLIEFRIVEDGPRVTDIDVALQFNPRLATSVAREHRQIDALGQSVSPHGKRKNRFAAAPVETFSDDFRLPHVLTFQAPGGFERIEPTPCGHAAEIFNAQNISRWKFKLIETCLRFGQNRFALLMK